ncbi:MAG: FtsW/RodA/SpoVE family cell cycle protein [Sarcina sp.]
MSLKEEKIQHYLNDICSLVKNKRVHNDIKTEISSHLKELETNYEKEGFSEEESIDKALINLGNSKYLGTKLNKVHKATIDFKLLIMTILLVLFGFLSAYSFENSFPSGWFSKPILWHGLAIPTGTFVVRDLIFVILGLIFFCFFLFFDFRKLKKLSIVFYVFATILTFLLYLYPNPSPNFKHYSGFVLGPFNMFILPLVPILYLFALSHFYNKINWNKKLGNFIWLILTLVPLTFMVFVTNSTELIIYYGLSTAVITFINSKSKKKIYLLLILELIIFFIFNPNFLTILTTNPNWQFNSVAKILLSSKFIGSSNLKLIIGQSYPITNIIATYGYLLATIIILALLYFIFRILKVGFLTENNYGKSLAFAISIPMTIEILWSILMNFNLLPFVSLSAPFITTGGESIILNLIFVGLLINIYKGRTLKS